MERTVPVRSSEEIELYLRTIYSLLRSTNEVRIRSLEVAHAGMNSSLHTLSQSDSPDTSALVYALMRLPDCIFHAQKVIMGQSESGFLLHGIGPVETWDLGSEVPRRKVIGLKDPDGMHIDIYQPERQFVASVPV